MSREIKFRVWAKKRKGYRELDQLVFDNQGLEEIWVFPKDDEMQQVYHPSEMVVEQYTGLTDKNGKEIYEGDIVKTNSPDRANFNAGAIVMQQQMYLIINTPTYGDARLSHSEPLGYYCDMECEIIGNIHENKELLGGGE